MKKGWFEGESLKWGRDRHASKTYGVQERHNVCVYHNVSTRKREKAQKTHRRWRFDSLSLTSHFHTLSNCIKFFWMMHLKFELKRCCWLILDGWCSAWERLWFRYSSDCTSQLFTIKSQSSRLMCSHIVKPQPECSHCICKKTTKKLLSGFIRKSQWRFQGRFVY